MTYFDFTAAFDQGQEAAKQSELSRAEIDGIVRDLSHQISAVTHGALNIFIELDAVVAMAAHLVKTFGIKPPSRGDSETGWIAASNSKAAESGNVRLAKWERPAAGYPCTLTYNEHVVRCHDKEALQQGLADMLKDVGVAERLRELLARPPQIEEGRISPTPSSE